jgi:predicted aspartyl protease
MGETKVKVMIFGLSDARLKGVEAECIVDTGATLTTLPAGLLKQAKITPAGQIKLHLADGREITRDYGNAMIKLNGDTIPARVIFGQAKDPALLGVTVLETAGLMVDPVARKLVKLRYYQQY